MIDPPNCFRPNKDLSQKVEDLKNKPNIPKDVSEELLEKDILKVLAGDYDKTINPYVIGSRLSEVIDDAFKKVIEDSYKGRIKWEKDTYSIEKKYRTKATVLNAKGDKVILPFLFHFHTFHDFSDKTVGYLHVGTEGNKWPCLNTVDVDVKKFARTYFKIDVS